ncbi:MAG: tetratricopeptide repeat protein [Rhodospirillaceae bacterium]|jgi:tetratricopeptide (TPR) repeat protein|nr:tetratricopeptide repeat protein [Rhodospirillaceae bacterium]
MKNNPAPYLEFRRVGTALATGLFLLASAATAMAAGKNTEPPRIKPGVSAVGNYLAGRHAQASRDMSAALTYLNAALTALPDAPDLQRRTFILLVIEGRIDEALPLARDLLKKNPKAPIANLTLAVEALIKGNHEEVVKRFDDGSDRGLNSFTGPMLEAWSLAGNNKSDAAIQTLGKLSGNESTQGLHDVHVALLRDFLGDAGTPESYADLAKKKLTGSFRIVQHMGRFHERQGNRDKARNIYDQFRADLPGTTLLDVADARLKSGKKPEKILRTAKDGAAEALFSIANSLRRQRARETALVLARLALHLRQDFPIAQILVADILDEDERYAEANTIYAAINKASPFRASAEMNLGNNLDQMGQTEEAIAVFRSLANNRAHDPQPMTLLGNLLRRHERWDEAIKAYTEAISRVGILEKRHWRMLYARGIALERAKRWRDAENDFQKALEFEPEQPFVLNYLGYSWIDQGLHLDKAQGMIRRAVELRPNDGYIIDSLGWGYYRLGKYEAAVKELERAIQIRPEDPIINDHLGDAYWRVGRALEARFQWQRSLSLKPEKDVISKIEKKLQDGMGEAEILKAPIANPKTPENGKAPPVLKKI